MNYVLGHVNFIYSYMRWILLDGFEYFMLITFTNVTEVGNSPSSGISKGALAGIVVGTIARAVTLSVIVSLLILRVHMRKHHAVSKWRNGEYLMFMKLGCLGRHIMIFHFPCNLYIITKSWRIAFNVAAFMLCYISCHVI